MSLGYCAEPFATRADLRYSAGGNPCTARKTRLKSPALENPTWPRWPRPGGRPAPDRKDPGGSIRPPAAIDDFTLRFAALLDGLSILRLRQMHQPSRKRLVEMAMTTARAELAPDAAAAPAG